MNTQKLVNAVLAGKLNMEWYAKRIASSSKEFKVTINKTEKGYLIFVSNPLLDTECVFKYGCIKKTGEMKLEFYRMSDVRMANLLIQIFFCNSEIYNRFKIYLESRLIEWNYSPYVWSLQN